MLEAFDRSKIPQHPLRNDFLSQLEEQPVSVEPEIIRIPGITAELALADLAYRLHNDPSAVIITVNKLPDFLPYQNQKPEGKSAFLDRFESRRAQLLQEEFSEKGTVSSRTIRITDDPVTIRRADADNRHGRDIAIKVSGFQPMDLPVSLISGVVEHVAVHPDDVSLIAPWNIIDELRKNGVSEEEAQAMIRDEHFTDDRHFTIVNVYFAGEPMIFLLQPMIEVSTSNEQLVFDREVLVKETYIEDNMLIFSAKSSQEQERLEIPRVMVRKEAVHERVLNNSAPHIFSEKAHENAREESIMEEIVKEGA